MNALLAGMEASTSVEVNDAGIVPLGQVTSVDETVTENLCKDNEQ